MKPGSEPYWRMYDARKFEHDMVRVPKQTWKLQIASNFFIYFNEDQRVPNWFYRKMSRLLLGWNWIKI